MAPRTRAAARSESQQRGGIVADMPPARTAGTKRKATSEKAPRAAKRPRQGSAFLELPPELRNRIYEALLVESPDITVDDTFRPPSVLGVSRQVRQEAIGIWFNQNVFVFNITDCDAAICMAWTARFARYDGMQSEPPIRTVLTGSPNWPNVMIWARRLHGNYGYSEAFKEDVDDDMFAPIAAALHIVSEAGEENLSWTVTEKMLQGLHYAISGLDQRWK